MFIFVGQPAILMFLSACQFYFESFISNTDIYMYKITLKNTERF